MVTKATALDLLARDLGIEPSQVVSFGDNHNDLAMLRWAGRGYAMANATSDAKAAAREAVSEAKDVARDDPALAKRLARG